MKYLWKGTRVSPPCVITVGANPPVVALAIYGRGRDGDLLQYSVQTVLCEPFEFTGPAEMVSFMARSHMAVAETSIGSVAVRPLMAADACLLPVEQGLAHDADMVRALVTFINDVEMSDDEGPFEAEQSDPLETLELLISHETDRAFALCWSVNDLQADEVDTWFREAGKWRQAPPTAASWWKANGGPGEFDWNAEGQAWDSVDVHPTAMARVLALVDEGRPISGVSAGLAGMDQVDGHIFAGDMPRGAARELAGEWLRSGGDPADPIVRFAEGGDMYPVDALLGASLARDQRAVQQRREVQEAGSADATAWMDMAELAVAATERHLWHEEPCDDIHCRRMSFAVALMAEVDGPMSPFGERGELVNGMRLMIEDLVGCMPASRPFTGVLEAPESYIRFAQAWRDRLTHAADEFDASLKEAIAAAYAQLFPSCGGMAITAELERAGLVVPEPAYDDW